MIWLKATMMAMAAPAAAGVHGPARTAILEAARAPAESDLGQHVRFLVERQEWRGDWAFLLADMQNPHGQPIDLAASELAAAAREGMASHSYAALLSLQDGHWRVVDHATAPTDVAWEGWAREHGAPAALFAR